MFLRGDRGPFACCKASPPPATAASSSTFVSFNLFSPTQGITKMVCHPTEPLILTGCIDGVVRAWDVRTGACTHAFRGFAETVQDLALSPDGSLVLAGAEDGTCRVFSLKQQDM